MRFMVLVKADEKTESGVMPSESELAEMQEYNEQLVKAGVMLAGEDCIRARRVLACASPAAIAR